MISLRSYRGLPLRLLTVVTLLCALAATGPGPVLADPIVLYVDRDATGLADGTSWTNAFTTLQDGLDSAVAPPGTAVEIWVAEGVYYPDEGIGHVDNDATESFVLNSSAIHVYGGFAGTESLRDERDWQTHVTVLSGDIDQNDTADEHRVVTTTDHISGTNSYHVVIVSDTPDPATGEIIIDGITITAGRTVDSGELEEAGGGGLQCLAIGAETTCSPIVANVTFAGNQAVGGGGMYNLTADGGISNPTLLDVIFSGNLGTQGGGAMWNDGIDGVSSPTLINVSFTGNHAEIGGGTLINLAGPGGISSPTIVNAVFAGNTGTPYSAIVNWASDGTVSPTLINVTVTGNAAGDGSPAIANANLNEAIGTCAPVLVNVVIWSNTGDPGSVQMDNYFATPIIAHSNIQGSGGSGDYGGTTDWDTSLGIDGGGNIDADPRFVSAPNAGDGDWATLGDNDYGDLRLQAGSPALNAGSNAALPADMHDVDGDGDTTELLPIDFAGAARIQDAIVDMGAYEGAAIPTRVAVLPLRSAAWPALITMLIAVVGSAGGQALRGKRRPSEIPR
jgi:hypothetical protein